MQQLLSLMSNNLSPIIRTSNSRFSPTVCFFSHSLLVVLIMAVVPPESMKSLHSYLKLAADTDARDPVLAYWIRFFVVNRAMKLDRSSPDAVKFLMTMMDVLETVSYLPAFVISL